MLDPIEGRMVWTAADMAASPEWMYRLTDADIGELDGAVAGVRERGLDIVDVARADFPLPALGPTLDRLRDEVVDGRGVAMIRGVPVGRLSREEVAIAYWGIGTYIGDAVSQNPLGHVLGHVKDIGVDAADVNKRGYQSHANLPFHTDIGAEVVGLMCLQPSKSGGVSSVVSGAAVYNAMLKRRPDLVDALSVPMCRDRRGEIPEGRKPYYAVPVFSRHAGHLIVSYVRRFIESVQRFPEVPRVTAEQTAAMDLLNELAYSDALRLDMDFEPGDIQLVNNIATLHTRTEYEDHDDPARKRHLLRLWLAIPDGWPLPDCFYERYGANPKNGRPAGIDIAGVAQVAPLDVA